jgi:hypothetical protein
MPVKVFNAAAPLLEGFVQGHAIAQRIRQAAIEEAHLAMQQQQFEQQRQMQDLGLVERFNAIGARPVEGGAVTEEADIPGMVGVRAPITRKADSSRTVRYKTRAGQDLTYELPTPEEQARRARETHQADLEMAERVKDTAAADRLRREGLLVTPEGSTLLGGIVPAGTRVPLANVDDILRAMVYHHKLGRGKSAPLHLQSYPNYETGDVTPTVLSFDEQTGRPKLVTGEPARGIARPRPREGRPNGPTPGQVSTQFKQYQDQIDRLQAQEDKLHNERLELGAQLKSGKVSARGGEERDLNALERATKERKIEQNAREIARIQGQKRRLLAAKDALAGVAPIAADAGGGLANPYR